MMKHIHSFEDEMRGVCTYELPSGRRVTLDAYAVKQFGAATILHSSGLIDDPSRLPRQPVYRDGKQIGTVAGDFDPSFIRSSSLLYDPRPGDFVAHGDGWIVAPSLGLGDIAAVVGFRRNEP